MAKNKPVEQVEGETPSIVTPSTPTPIGPKATVPKTEKKIFYVLGREVTKDDKMAAQCSVVYQHIANHCAQFGKCDRKALIDGITPEELKTRQGVDRIVAYYTPALLKAGLIVKEVEILEVPAVVAPATPAPAETPNEAAQ
jgi:hypothetical protein